MWITGWLHCSRVVRGLVATAGFMEGTKEQEQLLNVYGNLQGRGRKSHSVRKPSRQQPQHTLLFEEQWLVGRGYNVPVINNGTTNRLKLLSTIVKGSRGVLGLKQQARGGTCTAAFQIVGVSHDDF